MQQEATPPSPGSGRENTPLFYALSAILLLATLLTRFTDLGAKPPHHDESMHAFYSLQIVKTGDYQYVPFFHGPFQFYGNATLFRVFGDSTAVSRCMAAGSGVMAVLLALWMHPFLGRAGAFFAALFLAISPGFMYFNRFCREDSPYIAAILALVLFLSRYLRSHRPRDLWLAALSFALAYCTKETIFINLLVFGSFLFFFFLARAMSGKPFAGTGFSGPLRDMEAPTIAVAALIFFSIFILLYSSFFMIAVPSAASDRMTEILKTTWQGAFGSVAYWIGQHSVHRGDQPFYYYFLMLLAYEPLVFLFSVGASVYYLFFKRKALPLFLAYWFLGDFLLLSWFGEKMPWLPLHIILPAALLSGCFLGEMWDSLFSPGPRKGAAIAVLSVAGLLLGYSGWTAFRLCFENAANPAEPYVYVQSTPDCLEVEKIVRKIAGGDGQGTHIPLTIEDKCSWPFAWLFRDFDNRNHPSEVTNVKDSRDPSGVIPLALTAVESDAKEYPLLKKAGFVERRYKLRAWWVYSWFKGGLFNKREMTAGLFWKWLWGNLIPIGEPQKEMVDWGDLWKWIAHREVWSSEGSYDMRLWVRGDLAKKYGYAGDSPAKMGDVNP